jgi:leucyl/phenylalanyl-tRNA---protein transferase
VTSQPRISPELIVAAYQRGFFPMAGPDGRIRWYLPERRAVFLPGDARISASLARVIRRGRFSVAIDRDFEAVIRACAARDETWISHEIEASYCSLHHLGVAHSVETYEEGRLAGGLYGVALGGVFFGESMFHRATDASKVAFAYLCRRLEERGFVLHDAQMMTPHLASMGAREISRMAYERLLQQALRLRCSFT